MILIRGTKFDCQRQAKRKLTEAKVDNLYPYSLRARHDRTSGWNFVKWLTGPSGSHLQGFSLAPKQNCKKYIGL